MNRLAPLDRTTLAIHTVGTCYKRKALDGWRRGHVAMRHAIKPAALRIEFEQRMSHPMSVLCTF